MNFEPFIHSVPSVCTISDHLFSLNSMSAESQGALNHTLINDNPSYRTITGVINFCFRFVFRGARVICVKNLLALISGVLMIVFRKCFANFITGSWGVNKNRAAVVQKIYASVQ